MADAHVGIRPGLRLEAPLLMDSDSTKASSPHSAVFVILGGAGGIGSDVVRRLRARGHAVIAAGRSAEPLTLLREQAIVATAPGTPVGPLGTALLDAADFDAVAACLTDAKARFGRLDGVANCVGSILLKPAHQTSAAELEQTIRTNLFSAFATVAGAAKTMDRGGSVVLCATAAALSGFANHEAIAAAKGAVIGLMQAAAATYAPRNIRINAVAPGLVRTPLSARITDNEAALRTSVAMHALGRIGEPSHVAAMIEWLLDPANDWTTGQVFTVDGGLSGIHARPSTTPR